jgi:pyruvate ferredoxin oxidoreductase gamma subunit
LKEIRIHGRGGQGSVILAELLAIAAWNDGRYSQAFPFLGGGGERRGKPIQAFARIDDRFIRLRSRIHHPDYVIIQDYTILNEIDALAGLKEGGKVFVNTERSLSPPERKDITWIEIPASNIAMEVVGRPLMNAALLGAFSKIAREISLESVEKAILKQFHGSVGRQNVEIARTAYQYLGRDLN